MTKPIVILNQPHTEIVAGQVERCCWWTLTEAVEGVTTGEVGAVMDPNWVWEDCVEELKRLAVAAINGLQSTHVFDEGDCIVWGL
jgi:hypothetical protein